MTEGALAALVTGAVRAMMAAQAEGADAIAAGVTDVPGPVLGELFSTTLARNPHKLYLFKLEIVATNLNKISEIISQLR